MEFSGSAHSVDFIEMDVGKAICEDNRLRCLKS